MTQQSGTIRKATLAAALATSLFGANAHAFLNFNFAPGAVTVGVAEANVHGGADLNALFPDGAFGFPDATNWSWQALQNGSGDLAWPMVFVDPDNDGIIAAGAEFREQYTLALINLQNGGATVSAYGDVSAPPGGTPLPVDSHVYMTAELVGTNNTAGFDLAGDGSTTGQLSELDLTYTSVVFKMFFDPDGAFGGTTHQIAEFDGSPIDPAANESGSGLGDQNAPANNSGDAFLAWNVSIDKLVEGVLEIDGIDYAAGGGDTAGIGNLIDVSDDTEGLVKFTTQTIQRTEVDPFGSGSPSGNFNGCDFGGFFPGSTCDGSSGHSTLVVIGNPAAGTNADTFIESFPVPEPGTLGMLGLGLMGIGVAARRRKVQ